MPTSKHTTTDLNASQKTALAKHDAATQAQIQIDYAIDGPLQIEDPSIRVMTGAVNTAQAAAQVTAISNAGGLTALQGKTIAETGKGIGK